MKFMKNLVIVLLIFISFLVGCNVEDKVEEKEVNAGGRTHTVYEHVDKDTGCQYLIVESTRLESVAITPRYNNSGSSNNFIRGCK